MSTATASGRAGNRIFDLCNESHHVAKLAENAQIAFRHGRASDATAHLALAKQKAGMLDYYLREAIKALAACSDDCEEPR